MNRVHIQKAEDAYSEKDGQTLISNAHPENESFWCLHEGEVYMHCVGVWGLSALTNHSIESNGEVNASVLSTDGTGAEYHEFVILDGWNPSMYKIAGEKEQRTK